MRLMTGLLLLLWIGSAFAFPEQEPPPIELPEPASLALMGLGLAGLMIARKKRDK